MNNYEIADHFSLLSKLMDIHGENSFKSKSYSNAAFNIERLPVEAAIMTDAELYGAKGIGDSTGKKIRELIANGRLQQLDELVAVTPPGILDMLKIKGLGPKKIAIIWNELGIESLGELEYACNENRLVALKGFGAKTQESVLQNILYFKQNIGLYLWAEVEEVAKKLIASLQAAYPGNLLSLSGEVRRQAETVAFIDIVTDIDKALIALHFNTVPGADIEDNGTYLQIKLPEQPRIRVHSCTSAGFYSVLWRTTCGAGYLEAVAPGYDLPETAASEEELFAAMGTPYIHPRFREVEIGLEQGALLTVAHLIQPNDIKGIIHSHSTWSDGEHTIAAMAEAAKSQGLEYLVISDHSQSAFYAGGLKPEQIAAQHQEIDALNERLAPFRIFKSIESDILGDGSLDYTSPVLDTFDLVIASVHSNLKMSQEKAMERVLTAVRNPYTAILGHPTGRLLLSRKGYPLDHKLVIDTCAEHNVVLEINAHPRRLDLDWRWVGYALERGVQLSVDPDAHSIDGFKDTRYGVIAAQKGGLTAARNLSSFSLAQMYDFVTQVKAKRVGR